MRDPTHSAHFVGFGGLPSRRIERTLALVTTPARFTPSKPAASKPKEPAAPTTEETPPKSDVTPEPKSEKGFEEWCASEDDWE